MPSDGPDPAQPVVEARVDAARGLFRVYDPAVDEFDDEGYPRAWHRLAGHSDLTAAMLVFLAGDPSIGIKDIVRAEAGHRCIRCGHPYAKGAGEWSPCDDNCSHDGVWRLRTAEGWLYHAPPLLSLQKEAFPGAYIEARWRILTVHHLNGVKADCRWWNLAALCQRCHLTIQGKVYMSREYIRPHTDWFKPYAAAHYAFKYLGQDLTRAEVDARLDELLALELRQDALFDRTSG